MAYLIYTDVFYVLYLKYILIVFLMLLSNTKCVIGTLCVWADYITLEWDTFAGYQ